jgi:NitT/TauT family transport system substrate-binding protein
MLHRREFCKALAAAPAALAAPMLMRSAFADEVSSIVLVSQHGLPYLPMMVMDTLKLVEKHADRLGVASLKTDYKTLGGTQSLIDALLSRQMDFGVTGVPGLATLWDKTSGTPNEIRALSAVQSMPFFLVTSRPTIKTLADFTDQDKIALPAVKVSIQAVILEMAAAREWGDASYAKLDELTMSLSPPDATTGLLSGSSSFNCAFTVPPFQNLQLRDPAIHTVLDSTALLGDSTTVVAWTSKNFHDANPTVYRAIVNALKEASDLVAADMPAAVGYYVEDSKTRLTAPEILGFIADPRYAYFAKPTGTMKYADFMQRVGKVKRKAASWQDLFFPEIYDLGGS